MISRAVTLRVLAAALFSAALGGMAPAAHGHPTAVVVVSPQRGLPYSDLARGITETLARHDGSTASMMYLTANGDLLREEENRLRDAVAVIAIGSLSHEAVRRVVSDRTSVVACAVLSAAAGPAVQLRHAPDEVLRRLQRLLPGARTIGMLLGEGHAPAEVEALRARARLAGLMIEAVTVDSGASLERGIAQLSDRSDVILATQDLSIYTPENAQRILTSTLRHRIAFIGPSEPWVRAGALAALDWDWRELGRQCADASMRSLHERGAVVEFPRRAPLSINQRTARYLRMAIDPALLREARRIYE